MDSEKYNHRIALIIDGSSLTGQRLMLGACRRATAYPSLLVRRFFVDSLIAGGMSELLNWKPDGFVVYCDDMPLLQEVRKSNPNAPLVAMNGISHQLVDAAITASAVEVVTLVIKHFKQNMLTHFALFYSGDSNSAHRHEMSFREQLRKESDSFSLFHHHFSPRELQQEPTGEMLEQTGAWLRSLPKPVGIHCPADHSAAYLVRVCNHFNLRVPEDIQVIACDELDESLECLPHLTTVHVPAERIGGTAIETLLKIITGSLPYSKHLLIEGATLAPQGSTGMIEPQLSDVPSAIAFIQSHAMRGATVDDVLKATQQVSRMTFYRDFEQETGESPARYIRRFRIEAACRMLTTTEMEITRIAELTGFSSSNYFTQVFRRETGMTPNRYRKTHTDS